MRRGPRSPADHSVRGCCIGSASDDAWAHAPGRRSDNAAGAPLGTSPEPRCGSLVHGSNRRRAVVDSRAGGRGRRLPERFTAAEGRRTHGRSGAVPRRGPRSTRSTAGGWCVGDRGSANSGTYTFGLGVTRPARPHRAHHEPDGVAAEGGGRRWTSPPALVLLMALDRRDGLARLGATRGRTCCSPSAAGGLLAALGCSCSPKRAPGRHSSLTDPARAPVGGGALIWARPSGCARRRGAAQSPWACRGSRGVRVRR